MWLHFPPSHSVAEEGDSSADAGALASLYARFCTWRGRLSPLTTWQKRFERLDWLKLQSGAISKLSQEGCSESYGRWLDDTLSPSLLASPASHGAPPASAKAPTTSDGSGTLSTGSFARWDQASSSSRTSPGWQAVQATLLGSHTYSGPWPTRGSMRSGICTALPKREPHTFASGSSSSQYPTPSASRYGRNKGGQNPDGPERPSLDTWARDWGQWQTPGTDSFRSRGGDRKDEMGLDQQARRWGVPWASDQTKAWPTATDGDSRQSGGRNETAVKDGTTTHPGTSLTDASRLWPTATASEAGSNMNSNMKDKGMTSLRSASRSFPQVPTTGADGSEYSTLADRISSLGLSRSLNWRFQWWLMGLLTPSQRRELLPPTPAAEDDSSMGGSTSSGSAETPSSRHRRSSR